jgi:hypothetical protein
MCLRMWKEIPDHIPGQDHDQRHAQKKTIPAKAAGTIKEKQCSKFKREQLTHPTSRRQAMS